MNFLLENIAFILIGVGLLNIGIFFYFKHLIKKTLVSIAKVIKLNSDSSFDNILFLEQFITILQDLELYSYGYKIEYMGLSIVDKQTSLCANLLNIEIKHGDNALLLQLCPKKYRGEYKLRYEIMKKILELILYNNILIKSEAVNKSIADMAQYHTFILHDAKNIFQYLLTLNHLMLTSQDQSQDHELCMHIKQVLPQVSSNAQRLINSLAINPKEHFVNTETSELDIRSLIQKILYQYKIDSIIENSALVEENENNLHYIFENIIKNFKDKQEVEPEIRLRIYIESCASHVEILFHDNGTQIKNLQNLFKPFSTTKREGLGVGLYKSKKLLENINAAMRVKSGEDGVSFTVILNIKSEI